MVFINMDKERIQYDSKNNEFFILEIREDDELKNTDFIFFRISKNGIALIR